MKTIYTLLLSIFVLTGAFAQTITQQQAQTVAKAFYYEHVNQFKTTSYHDIIIKNSYTVAKNNQNTYHVVNIQPHAYVIVAADKAINPIIAYSYTSYCPQSNQIAPFTWWMDKVSDEIIHHYEQNIKASSKYAQEWERLLTTSPSQLQVKTTKAVTPLLHTTWNQGKYYNGLCPDDNAGPGGHAYAGCVPTAMAQVMNYYRWPQQGTGSYSYLDSTYGTQSVNFATSTYEWCHMPMSLSNDNFDIAQLLYHIGVSCDLRYGANGSGMYNHKAGFSYRTYFKYVDSTRYMFRDTATFDWRAVLIDHLDRQMPMYYAGWSDTIYQGGHAFVCDGYQDTTFFHFNWGWGGSYDGYFNLDNLTPGGANFTLLHEAVINCYPDTAYSPYPYYCTGPKVLTAMDGSIEDGSGPIDDYLDNVDCSWLIQPQGDSLTKITLEFYAFETASANDIVTVYDGATNSDPVLGTYSASTLPPVLNSTGTAMLVEFHSDASGTAGGFLAEYTSTRVDFCNMNEYLYTTSGQIEDGSGSFNYHNSELCRWFVQPTGVGSFTIDFLALDLDSSDYLKIYDDQSTVLAELRGDNLPLQATYYTTTMLLMFSSSATDNAQGFSLDYTTSPVGIEEEANAQLKVYPNPATDKVQIEYKDKANTNIHIELYNTSAQLLYTENLSTDANGILSKTLSLKEYTSGVYFLKFSSNESVSYVKLLHK